MKFYKSKSEQGTIRKVWDEESHLWIGVIGTVGDLLKARILEYCDYERDIWAFIPMKANVKPQWATTKEALINLIK